jgi:DNA-binding NarL/FixJ family response regulator
MAWTETKERAPVADAADIRLLIVDDSAIFREALAGFLAEIQGLRVVGTAANGEEGLALVARLDPAVVLMDLRMTGLDGFETTRCLKRLTEPPAVVALTTYDDERVRRAALASGADAFVLKRRAGVEIVPVVRAVAQAAARRGGPARDGDVR